MTFSSRHNEEKKIIFNQSVDQNRIFSRHPFANEGSAFPSTPTMFLEILIEIEGVRFSRIHYRRQKH